MSARVEALWAVWTVAISYTWYQTGYQLGKSHGYYDGKSETERRLRRESGK